MVAALEAGLEEADIVHFQQTAGSFAPSSIFRSVACCTVAAAPAFHRLDRAAGAEAKGGVDDAVIVETEPAK